MSFLHRFLEFAPAYRFIQQIGEPTVKRFRSLIKSNIKFRDDRRYLDLGCGIGNYRDCFPQDYWGVDINPEYMRAAQSRLSGNFSVMDCTKLSFAEGFFDDVVTIATTHHLSDDQLLRTVCEALRVCKPGGHLHVIDAILPVTRVFWFKTLWFRLDRGNFPREQDDLARLLGMAGRVVAHDMIAGPLHDTAYFRIAAAEMPSPVA